MSTGGPRYSLKAQSHSSSQTLWRSKSGLRKETEVRREPWQARLSDLRAYVMKSADGAVRACADTQLDDWSAVPRRPAKSGYGASSALETWAQRYSGSTSRSATCCFPPRNYLSNAGHDAQPELSDRETELGCANRVDRETEHSVAQEKPRCLI
jgi:hypothetical protein